MRTFMFCHVCGSNWISNVPICIDCLVKYTVTPTEILDALGEYADFPKLAKLLEMRRVTSSPTTT